MRIDCESEKCWMWTIKHYCTNVGFALCTLASFMSFDFFLNKRVWKNICKVEISLLFYNCDSFLNTIIEACKSGISFKLLIKSKQSCITYSTMVEPCGYFSPQISSIWSLHWFCFNQILLVRGQIQFSFFICGNSHNIITNLMRFSFNSLHGRIFYFLSFPYFVDDGEVVATPSCEQHQLTNYY